VAHVLLKHLTWRSESKYSPDAGKLPKKTIDVNVQHFSTVLLVIKNFGWLPLTMEEESQKSQKVCFFRDIFVVRFKYIDS
jgi:hypothetical protein